MASILRVAVCDDEPVFRDRLVRLLQDYFSNHDISGYQIDKFASGIEFCALGKEMSRYDILFLDINMETMSGIETAEEFRRYAAKSYLVFITAFIDYAIEGYHVDAIRYLLKDNLDKTFAECMECIMHKSALLHAHLEYEFLEGRKRIAVDDLMYVESQRHKLFFHMNEKKKCYSLYGKLDDIETDVKEFAFIRIHKSYMVNSQYIERMRNYKAVLSDHNELPVPREKYRSVRETYYSIRGDL